MGDNRVKKYMMQQNIYACKFGIFQDLPVMKSQKSFYNDDFNIAPPYEYGNVLVNTKHSIDVANEYAQKVVDVAIANAHARAETPTNDTGKCLWCSNSVKDTRRWCSVECRNEHERHDK